MEEGKNDGLRRGRGWSKDKQLLVWEHCQVKCAYAISLLFKLACHFLSKMKAANRIKMDTVLLIQNT